MIVKQLPADPYRQTIFFLYGTPEELTKWCAHKYPKARAPIEFPKGHRGKFFEYAPSNGEDCVQFIALVKRKVDYDTKVTWLAHECLHCAVAVLEAKGVPLDQRTDEALTYYFQWVFSNCLKYLRG